VARFLKHIGCDRCGSSDAKAVYDDGSSFCFSCRSVNSAKISPYVTQNANKQNDEEMLVKSVCYPSDVSQCYSEGALAWCKKYDITVEQLLQNNIYYSSARDQLIFGFEAEGKLLAYQARNLNPVSKGKRYYTCGDVNELLPIYHCRYPLPDGVNSRRLVLVEDCLSAIKVASIFDELSQTPLGSDSMPLLGSGISRAKLSRLRPFYDVLDVFLDPDMWDSSLQIAGRAQLLGFKVRPIQSDCDPKEHTYKELDSLLRM
jgi:ribosomal protein L37E